MHTARRYYYPSSLPLPSASASPGAPAAPSQRPQALVAVVARPALPQAPPPGGRGAAADLVAARCGLAELAPSHAPKAAALFQPQCIVTARCSR